MQNLNFEILFEDFDVTLPPKNMPFWEMNLI